VIDLMQALQQSLHQMPQKKPASKATSIEVVETKEPTRKERAKAAR
jgi:hypothetical protein